MCKTISNQTANAAMAEVHNKLTEVYKNTTVKTDNAFNQTNLIKISTETDKYSVVVMACYDEDESKIFMGITVNGRLSQYLYFDPSVTIITVDELVELMVTAMTIYSK